MKYVGAKTRIVDQLIYPMVKKRGSRQYFVDLFCGGANVCGEIRNPRIANDIDEDLIEMFIALQNGWEPPTSITEYEYTKIRRNQLDYPAPLRAFVGYNCSFGAIKWGSFAKGFDLKGKAFNYAQQSYNNLMNQLPKLRGIEWSAKDYRDVTIPPKSIIYCDIPYEDVHGYHGIKFDHEYFWYWVKLQSFRGHDIFVSSYNAPRGFDCIREMLIDRHINRQHDEPRVERLYRWS